MADAGARPLAVVALATTAVTLALSQVATAWQDVTGDTPGVGSPTSTVSSSRPEPRNRPPSAGDARGEIRLGGPPLLLDLSAFVSDPETAVADLAYALVRPGPRLGTVGLTGAVVTYTPDEGATGTDSFDYLVVDRGRPDGCVPGQVPCAAPSSDRGTVTIAIVPREARSGADGPDLTVTRGSVAPAGGGVAGAAPGDALTVGATVANRGTEASTPTLVWAGAPDLVGRPVRIASVRPRSTVAVEWTVPAPDGASETFVIAVDAVPHETDVTNNTLVGIVPEGGDGGFPLAQVGAFLALVLLLTGTASYVRSRRRRKPASRIAPGEAQAPAVPGMPGLGDLMDRYLGGEPGPALSSAGGAARAVLDRLHDRASPFLATVFWRSLLDTPALARVLEQAGASREALARPETLVVSHAGGTRYDLVLLDPDFGPEEPVSAPVRPSPEDLSAAWARISRDRAARIRPTGGLHDAVLADALRELSGFGEFGVVIAPRPDVVLTRCPSPPWGVATEEGEPSSTAGVAAVDGRGRTGVTVAEHAVRGLDRVVVDGRPAPVLSVNPVQDSAFVGLDPDAVDLAPRAFEPLRNVSPRQNEEAEFDGLQSGRATALVSGWDPTILTVEPFIQNKVMTSAVTMPGDSGAALVGADGRVLGFSFYVTGLTYPWPFSCWIWAESVFVAHGLRPLGGGS